MTLREQFEAWATSQGINITDNGFGGYDSQWTEGALAGWEAAQAQAAVEPVNDHEFWIGVCESLDKGKAMQPVCWGMPHVDGRIYDVICNDEHAHIEGKYTVPLYTSLPDTDRLQQRVRELESDLEKHRELLLHHLSVIDPLRDKNKRLCGLLREALSFMYPEIALHTVIEQEIAP